MGTTIRSPSELRESALRNALPSVSLHKRLISSIAHGRIEPSKAVDWRGRGSRDSAAMPAVRKRTSVSHVVLDARTLF
jgi:hypothetical protein